MGRQVVDQLPTDDDRLLVITEDQRAVETLRDNSVPARHVETIDQSTLASIDIPDVIFVGGDRTDDNLTVLEHARTAFPSTSIVAYLCPDATDADRLAYGDLADYVVDAESEMVDRLLEDTASPSAEVAIDLRSHLEAIDGRLAVMMHDNPDPDAIASAVALVDIADSIGLEADACYYGEISHQENRAMVNLLDLDVRGLDPEESLSEYAGIALIDHSRPGINDQLPSDAHIDIVIDHHPPRGPVPADFVDLREHVGATSTMLTEYCTRSGLSVPEETATALLYGIRVDTNDFTREVSASDFEAASTLRPRVNDAVLSQIEQPTVEGDTLDTIARAIKNREQRGSVLATSAGQITDRDALPQAADQLLAMDGVETTLVFGFIEGMAFLSARSRDSGIDLGETLRDAFDQIGSAGGHADMAGAQLEIGILASTDDEREVDSIVSIVEEVISNRFFEAIRTQPGIPVGTYSQTSEWLFTVEDESE